MNKKFNFIILLVFVFPFYLYGDDEFDYFLETLNETTHIASKENINVEYAPGIVSVIRYDELKRLGVQNLYEALKMVPNIAIDLDDAGTNQIVIRGIGGVLGSGKTKILINGVSQNTSNMALFYSTLPIDIIDRIEVLRGPGSVLYGGYAFNGTINIITKKDQNSIFLNYVKLNKNNTTNSGAVFSQKNGKFEANGVFSYTDTKGLEHFASDNYSNAHDVESNKQDENFIANIKYEDIVAKLAIYNTTTGEFYGGDKTLPDKDDKDNYEYKHQNIELSKEFLYDSFKLTPKIGFFKYSSDIEFTKFVPTSVITYNHPYNQYEKWSLGIDFNMQYNKHKLLLGYEWYETKEKDNHLTITRTVPFTTTTTSTKDENEKNKREVDAIYMQDILDINDKTTLSFGARYEKYDDKHNKDLDDVFLPKISSVYRYDENNIYKIQYGEAFRPTTFLENKSSDPKNIKGESISTIELQHIYKTNKQKISTTLFHSKLKDMLEQKSDNTNFWYENMSDNIISQGIELEYLKNYKEFVVTSNLSYTEAFNDSTKDDLADYSKVIGGVTLSHKPYSTLSTSLNLRYVGEKTRDISDSREKMDDVTTIDISCRYIPSTKSDKLDIVFGVKNITDEKVKSPSAVGGIPDDYVSERRSYFIGINYKL